MPHNGRRPDRLPRAGSSRRCRRIVARNDDPIDSRRGLGRRRSTPASTYNVIPSARAAGRHRAHLQADDARPSIERRIGEIVSGIAAGLRRRRPTLDYRARLPGDRQQRRARRRSARDAAADVVGEAARRCATRAPAMGAEDFAYMLQRRPGSYIWIGNGDGDQPGPCLHNPDYDFNDAALPVGASYWVRLVERLLPAA